MTINYPSLSFWHPPALGDIYSCPLIWKEARFIGCGRKLEHLEVNAAEWDGEGGHREKMQIPHIQNLW